MWSKENSYCLILEDNDDILRFAIGYFEQCDDIKAYDLVKIVIAYKYQNLGIGTKFMKELENNAKKIGTSLMEEI